MSAKRPNSIAVIGCGNPELALTYSRTAVFGEAGPGFIAALRVRIRNFLEEISGRRRKPPSHNGGPDEPSEDASPNSPWDDPALWMLMLH